MPIDPHMDKMIAQDSPAVQEAPPDLRDRLHLVVRRNHQTREIQDIRAGHQERRGHHLHHLRPTRDRTHPHLQTRQGAALTQML